MINMDRKIDRVEVVPAYSEHIGDTTDGLNLF